MSSETPPESLESLRRALGELQCLVSTTQEAGKKPQTPTGVAMPADYGGLTRLLGQVVLTYTAAGLRYWARVAEAAAKALPLASQAIADAVAAPVAGGGGESSRVRLEELGAHLRELAAMPSEEALRLVNDLARLGLAVGSMPPQESPEPQSAYWRRWEIKP